ncbi:MAG: transglutaminase domain-containing protein [Candidatus Aenigmatarchaeota archaeon]
MIKSYKDAEELIKIARSFVEKAKRNPDFVLFAQEIVFDVPENDKIKEIVKIVNFVKQNVRYVNDPHRLEMIIDPIVYMRRYRNRETLSGDCDDQAVFLSALLESIGYKTRLRGKIYKNKFGGHLICEVELNNMWIPLDTTIATPIGVEIDKQEEGEVFYGGANMKVYFKGQEFNLPAFKGALEDFNKWIVEASKTGELSDFLKDFGVILEYLIDKEKRQKLVQFAKGIQEEKKMWEYWFKNPLTWVLIAGFVGLLLMERRSKK